MTGKKSDLDIVTGIFEKLKSVDERSTFVQSLLESIPRKHIRELAYHAAAVDFRFDIIGNLPVEVLYMIFAYLEIYQAFQLRRVSKIWLKRLSAPDFVEAILQPWFALGDVDLRMPSNISAEEALAIKAEHVDAFQTGNPFSMTQGEWAFRLDDMITHRLSNIDYSCGRLAWVDEHPGLLHVRNLESGHETLHMPPNREKISGIRLSSDIVAAHTASGKCYVWDCATGAPHSLQLPSAWVIALTTSGKSLAVLHNAEVEERFDITTWHLDTRQTRSFQVTLQGRPWARNNQLLLEIRVTDDSVLFLEQDMGPPDEIFFTRYTLDGSVIAKGTSGLVNRTFRSGFLETITVPPQQSSFSVCLRKLDCIQVEDEEDEAGTGGIVRNVYNLRNGRFQSLREPAIPYEDFRKFDGALGGCWYFWKDAAFQFVYSWRGFYPSDAFNLSTGAKKDAYLQELEHYSEHWFRYNCPLERMRLFGDEIYMVRVHSRGFTVFCFDKNITMANEDTKFRQLREAARLKRIRRRDNTYYKDAERQANIHKLEVELARYKRESGV
ncbi:MAG: hypothetical protein Q9225_001211 [Loekoesia sp. 1 TL-2023]